MSEVSDWKTKDLENTAIDDLTLSAPQGSYWQKMMGAIARWFGKVGDTADLVTTDKSSIVAAVNEVAAGDGGSDWDFGATPVYTETLADNFDYDDEEGGSYNLAIPPAIIGDGFDAVLVRVQTPPTALAGGSLVFSFNNSFFAQTEGVAFPQSGTLTVLWSCLVYPFHGCTRVEASGKNFDSDLSISRVATWTLAPSKITSIALANTSLPAGTIITVFAPAAATGGE